MTLTNRRYFTTFTVSLITETRHDDFVQAIINFKVQGPVVNIDD